ncbi:transcriptional regulator [Acidithiobacillus caldus]|jgi:DNA-binding transcriptional regulator YdaS (Cro superfamily)|uniref:Helix-turn-helix domain-containing protein n=2 Tax=Igneacidithiobacillus copahuensis TaxID=2724909 RepID=A0AAE3CK45_9PROT|nr:MULTISPECIES: Cro/CI family transcriptional regulator [Acidithiobacillaceae]MBU2763345.1 helix-turn-helix domain-containing protein [Acidithiobacillus caldus]MBU2771184.1 helix-turn-helix domain-containing protein [Acidithiobacillus caldus]MBU2788389.1 helix-turn-helix domain-containing protein [Igneacidithiobacillus copahuensis]MBU2796373.1 helix-turn-helix domain-containing protein [Acidithiobacillus sp. VAN18-2]
MDALLRAIHLFGSQARLARALGVVPMAVTNWKKRGVPIAWAPEIERATNGLVTRAELRPDIFGPIDADPDRAGGVPKPPSTGEPPDEDGATSRLQEVDG